jgi:transcriptional regulator with XRE-family HTH domain
VDEWKNPAEPTAFRHLSGALRLLRDRRGITQRKLAEEAACTLKQISAYETARQRPRIETLERILGILDADASDLARAMAGLDAVDRGHRSGGRLPAANTAAAPGAGAALTQAAGRGASVRTLREIGQRLPALQSLADDLLLDVLADVLEDRARVVAEGLRSGAVPGRDSGDQD